MNRRHDSNFTNLFNRALRDAKEMARSAFRALAKGKASSISTN
jgi:hypothetical protein